MRELERMARDFPDSPLPDAAKGRHPADDDAVHGRRCRL